MYHDPCSLFRIEPRNLASPRQRALFSLPGTFNTPPAPSTPPTVSAPVAGGYSLYVWAVVVAVVAFTLWYFFGESLSALSAVVLTHPGCKQSLREDMRAGLIYGPYMRERHDLPRLVCSVCKGQGTWTHYSNDAINKELAGKPAPCEFCRGVGTRVQLEALTMAQWAEITGLCVYCGETRRKVRKAKEVSADV